jgi:hypothetical protein
MKNGGVIIALKKFKGAKNENGKILQVKYVDDFYSCNEYFVGVGGR